MEDYITIAAAKDYLKISRASLFNYMQALGIKTTHFKPDKRRAYLSSAQVALLKMYKEKPWAVQASGEVVIAEKQ